MFLLEILLALALVQFWSGHNPLHRDEWFSWWMARISGPRMPRSPYFMGFLAVLVPALLVLLAVSILPGPIVFLVSVVVLLYCLGRGEFGEELRAYQAACADGDWERASRAAARQGVDTDFIAAQDWPRLNEQMLKAASYQGFERLFAVIFWFALLGPFGAVLYRLSYAYHAANKGEVARHWLWALEWAPARLLGASFAVTGNFVGCVNRWRTAAFSLESTAPEVLLQSVTGALSVDDELVESCDVTPREVAAVRQLYVRTLWFWLAALALWVIFGPARLL